MLIYMRKQSSFAGKFICEVFLHLFLALEFLTLVNVLYTGTYLNVRFKVHGNLSLIMIEKKN